jgi:hypothetical protein
MENVFREFTGFIHRAYMRRDLFLGEFTNRSLEELLVFREAG